MVLALVKRSSRNWFFELIKDNRKNSIVYISMRSFKHIKAILFDIGDTLVETTPIINSSIYETAIKLKNKLGIKSVDDFIRTYKQIDSVTQGININHLYSDPIIIGKTIDSLNLKVDEIDIISFLIYYREEVRKQLCVDIKIIELFNFLKRKKYKMGIVSDGTTIEQLETLNKIGLLNYFDVISISQYVGIEKPDSQIFLYATDKLSGIDRAEIAMIGNDIERDIKGASRLGMYTIFLLNKDKKKLESRFNAPAIEINSIFELYNIL